jgi:hypothetical protein
VRAYVWRTYGACTGRQRTCCGPPARRISNKSAMHHERGVSREGAVVSSRTLRCYANGHVHISHICFQSHSCCIMHASRRGSSESMANAVFGSLAFVTDCSVRTVRHTVLSSNRQGAVHLGRGSRVRVRLDATSIKMCYFYGAVVGGNGHPGTARQPHRPPCSWSLQLLWRRPDTFSRQTDAATLFRAPILCGAAFLPARTSLRHINLPRAPHSACFDLACSPWEYHP